MMYWLTAGIICKGGTPFAWLLVVLCVISLVGTQSNANVDLLSEPFYTPDGEAQLLRWVQAAQANLRVYVYPIPPSPYHNENFLKKRRHDRDAADNKSFTTPDLQAPHFLIEQTIPGYFKQILVNKRSYGRNDSRKHLVVADASQANAFIIDHDWITSTRFRDCNSLFDHMLQPVIKQVVNNNKYYNHSKGADHFFMAVYDNGVWDTKARYTSRCYRDNHSNHSNNNHSNHINYVSHFHKDVLTKIAKANFISNFARNDPLPRRGAGRTHTFDGTQFIPGQDITIPQPSDFNRFAASHESWIVKREYDSSFTGTLWGDRWPLLNYTTQDATSANYERFLGNFQFEVYRNQSVSHSYTERHTNGSGELRHSGRWTTNFTDGAYFSYNPCGLGWCWSKRLWNSMLTKAIPVLSGSNLVMPFERFINWRAISVKVNARTWHNESGSLSPFRQRLRYEGAKFRGKLYQFWQYIAVNRHNEYRMQPEHMNRTTLDLAGQRLLDELQGTLIWRKMANIDRVNPWLYYDVNLRDNLPWKHPIKLLQLEMWCRVTTYESRRLVLNHAVEQDLCLRPTNVVAALEYF